MQNMDRHSGSGARSQTTMGVSADRFAKWSVRALAWIIGLVLTFQAAGAFALDVPKLLTRVTDLAGVLTPDQSAALENKLKQFEAADSTQIAILLIPSLEGEDLADFSIRVASAWRLGHKGRDNGALLFIAMKERSVRIEVGYGLEPTLTDARSRRIIETEILPAFREQQFYQGIDAGVTAIIQTVRGVYQAPRQTTTRRQPGSGGAYRLLFFLIAPLMWILGSTGKWGGGILGGGAGAYLIYAVLGYSLIPMLIAGVAGLVAGGFLGALVQAGSHSSGDHHRGGFGGPFFPGGFGGGGFGGGGGGGFSGGGGGFGGGGASGKW